MSKIEILSQLLDNVKEELPDGTEVKLSQRGNEQIIRVSWKTLDDPLRKSKRFQPIIIQLHEDFSTSEFAKRPFLEINKKFTAFIRKKCAEFTPRTTDNSNELHTVDYWIFPPEC